MTLLSDDAWISEAPDPFTVLVALQMCFISLVNLYVNRGVIMNPVLIVCGGFENAVCQVLETHCKYFRVGEKAVLRRNVFTMKGPGKGNGFPCITVGDWEQDEVRKLKNFNVDGGKQNIVKQSRKSGKGLSSSLRFRRGANNSSP
jgi:hypothetical protein